MCATLVRLVRAIRSMRFVRYRGTAAQSIELCNIALFRPTFSAFDSHMYGLTPVISLSVMLLLPAVYCCAMLRDVLAMPSSGDGVGICSLLSHLHTLQISSFLDTPQK